MHSQFDIEEFYSFIEIAHELKPFFRHSQPDEAFNYLDIYLLLKRVVDEVSIETDCEKSLHQLILGNLENLAPLRALRGGDTEILRAEVLDFIDALDTWRISFSSEIGSLTVIPDRRAFALLCDMYCASDEPGYSALYLPFRRQYDADMDPAVRQRMDEAVARINHRTFKDAPPPNPDATCRLQNPGLAGSQLSNEVYEVITGMPRSDE